MHDKLGSQLVGWIRDDCRDTIGRTAFHQEVDAELAVGTAAINGVAGNNAMAGGAQHRDDIAGTASRLPDVMR